MGLHEVERTFPKPNNAENEINDAKTKATSYIAYDPNTGLMVADMTNGTQTPSTATSRNVLVESTGVNIRDGQTILQRVGDVDNEVGSFIYDGLGSGLINIVAKFTRKVMKYLRNGVELFSLETGLEDNDVVEDIGIVCNVQGTTQTLTTNLTFVPSDVVETAIQFKFGGGDISTDWDLTDGQVHNIITQSGSAVITAKMEVADSTVSFTVWSANDVRYVVTEIFGTITYTTEDSSMSKVYIGSYPNKQPQTALAVGNGADGSNRSNAFEVTYNGNSTFSGGIASLVETGIFGSTFRITEEYDSPWIVTSAGNYGTETRPHELDGYYPICVAGYRFTDHHSTLQNVYRCQLINARSGYCEVAIGRRDISSDSNSGYCYLHTWVLWAKEA